MIVVTLALGIGASTATFSIFKAVVLDPLPYRQPERLVTIAESDAKTPNPQSVAPGTVYEWSQRSQSFERFCLWGDYALRPLLGDRTEFWRGISISYDYFDALGIHMLLGRTFNANEDQPANDDKIILSYPLWQTAFGGDHGVLGKTIRTVNEDGYLVVGILPEDFHPLHMSNPGEVPQFYVPMGLSASDRTCHSCGGLRLLGQLKRGVTADAARLELHGIMRKLAREYPQDYAEGASVKLELLRNKLLGKFDQALAVVFGAVGLLLLLACSNVANLLLIQTAGQQTEMALRVALGAGRMRLVALALERSLRLALIGGASGVMCAFGVVKLIARLENLEIPRLDEIRPDWWMFGWGLGISIMAAALFGLGPALEAWRLDLRGALQDGSKASLARGKQRFLHTMVSVEIATAFVLVLGVTLLGGSYRRLLAVDAGYDPRNVLTLTALPLSAVHHDNPEWLLGLYDRIAARMRAIPSVEAAGYASTLPLSNQETHRFYVREQGTVANAEAVKMNGYSVSPGYLRALKIRLLRGRLIDERDRRGAAPVALVSQLCERSQFGGRSAIGQHIQLDDRDDKNPWATVVGVVQDVHQYGLDQPADAAIYLPFAQVEHPQGWSRVVVRSSLSPDRIEPAVRRALREVDTTLPIFHLQPMDAYTAKSLAQRTLSVQLILVFGGIAVVLATVGVYGVVAYTVRLRRREMGIRVAVGAQRRDILWLVLRQVLKTALAGLAVGLGIALWLGRFVESLLFEVKSNDPGTITAVAALICGVALLAGLTPARKASGVDLASILRVD